MPFYEYHCETCGHDFENFARTMRAAAPKCPECGGGKVKRRLSVFGVGSAAPAPPPSPCQSCQQGGSCPMSR